MSAPESRLHHWNSIPESLPAVTKPLGHLGNAGWPAPGFKDTELGVLMEPEVCHGEAEVYAGVQA